jgi:phosphoserine phosphatase
MQLGPFILMVACSVLSCARSPMLPTPRSSHPLESHFRAASRLDELLTPGCLWVSDADGTLWSDDIGEGFLKHLVAEGALVSPDARGDVWAEYEARVRADKGAGYAWAVQVMAGLPEAEVQRRAEAFAREFVPANLYAGMRALVEAAKARGCEPWIVSASNEWVVRAAAPLVGIAPEHAVGIRVAVAEGRLTSTVVPPITYKNGKIVAIEQRIGRRPSLVSGDSSGDVEMLDWASGAALFVRHDYTDPALLEQAGVSGWLVEVLGR